MNLKLLASLFLGLPLVISSVSNADESFDVRHCPQGKVWKIAVVQGGPYIDFQKVFRQMLFSFQDKGLISEDADIDRNFTIDNKQHFYNFAASTKGSCIEFAHDSFYDGELIPEKNVSNIKTIKERIEKDKAYDLVFALGTVAGFEAAKANLGVPVMVITATDPELAGIVGQGEFSDVKNVHAQKEMYRNRTEILLFHKIFGFKKLGTLVIFALKIKRHRA